jgi:hypothetical protein
MAAKMISTIVKKLKDRKIRAPDRPDYIPAGSLGLTSCVPEV